MRTLYHDLLERYGMDELIHGFSKPCRQYFNAGNPPREKYIEKPVKPWQGKKKLSRKQRKQNNDLNI